MSKLQQYTPERTPSSDAALTASGFDAQGTHAMAPPPFQLMADPVQREADLEEELEDAPLQGKDLSLTPEEEDELPVQAHGLDPEDLEEAPTQLKSAAVQREAADPPPVNHTGMPDQLLNGIQNLSGFDMSDVRVHYNSDKPAQLQAHAYAQGTDIHLGPGQERHLPHEAWHVVQQKQGRVRPTMQLKGMGVNDDAGLEREADEKGAQAMGTIDTIQRAGGSKGKTRKSIKKNKGGFFNKKWNKGSKKQRKMRELNKKIQGKKKGRRTGRGDLLSAEIVKGMGRNQISDLHDEIIARKELDSLKGRDAKRNGSKRDWKIYKTHSNFTNKAERLLYNDDYGVKVVEEKLDKELENYFTCKNVKM